MTRHADLHTAESLAMRALTADGSYEKARQLAADIRKAFAEDEEAMRQGLIWHDSLASAQRFAVESANTVAAALKVADAWASTELIPNDFSELCPGLQDALNELELATRESSLRKVQPFGKPRP